MSLAVLRCEALTLAEVEAFCAMRHLDAEIFQEIASTREWIKQARIQLALVDEPGRAALDHAAADQVPRRCATCATSSRDRNLPEGVRADGAKAPLEKRRLRRAAGGRAPGGARGVAALAGAVAFPYVNLR